MVCGAADIDHRTPMAARGINRSSDAMTDLHVVAMRLPSLRPVIHGTRKAASGTLMEII
jgi:hypothetical protein